MKLKALLLSAMILTLAACEKKEAILTGERENIRAILTEDAGESTLATADTPAQAPPLSLPAIVRRFESRTPKSWCVAWGTSTSPCRTVARMRRGQG